MSVTGCLFHTVMRCFCYNLSGFGGRTLRRPDHGPDAASRSYAVNNAVSFDATHFVQLTSPQKRLMLSLFFFVIIAQSKC